MKKKRLRLLFILIQLLACQRTLAQSLSRLCFGVRINIASSRLIGNLPTNEFLFRPTFGFDLTKPISKTIQLTGQLLYSTYGNIEHFSGAAPGEKYITKYHYLTVPILVRINRPNSHFSINIGPQWGYLLNKDYVHINAPLGGSSTSGLVGPRLKNTDIGMVAGLGYRFSRHLYGDFRYYQSLTKLFKNYYGLNPLTGTSNFYFEGLKAFNQSFTIGTTYYF